MSTTAVRAEPTVENPSGSRRQKPKRRDPFLDNAKFIAIVLVVVGHAIEPLVRKVPTAHSLYLFLYMFHMPVFIVIAGYLSKNFPSSGDKVRKLFGQLLAPFVIFQLAYVGYARVLGGKEPDLNVLDPYYLTWFLLALFAWRASTPIWQTVRWPLAIAVAISVLAGTQELVDEFEMGRVLALLPFFVLGLLLRREHFDLLRRTRVRIAAAFVMLAGLLTAFWAADRMSLEWALWRSDNALLQVDMLTGSAMRFAMIVCAAVLAAAFLSLVPDRTFWFTSLGKWTLYVYLLHGFFIKGAEYLGWYDQKWIGGRIGMTVCALLGVLIALLLSTPFVRWVTRYAIEPPVGWLFRRREERVSTL